MKIFNFFIVIFSVFTILSCTSDDDNFSNKSHFNPPHWIHGKWSTSQQNDTLNFKFDYNNFYVSSTEEINYNDVINTSNSDGNNQIRVIEQVSDNAYFLTITNTLTKDEFQFKKISDAKLIYIHRDSEIELYRK